MRRFISFAAAAVIALLAVLSLQPRAAQACTDCGIASGGYVCEPGMPTGATSHYDCYANGSECYLTESDCTGAIVSGDGSVEAAPSYGADSLAAGEVVATVAGPSSIMTPTSVALRSPCNDAILSRNVSPSAARDARELTSDLTL